MDRATLTAELEPLGIDAQSWRLVALLPLVQVAWADGEIQPIERKIIMGVAAKRGLADGDGMAILERWLSDKPSAEAFARTQRMLRALVGDRISPAERGEIVAFCDGVARAAGGLLGDAPVTDAEREAVSEIATMLGVQDSDEWGQLRQQMDL